MYTPKDIDRILETRHPDRVSQDAGLVAKIYVDGDFIIDVTFRSGRKPFVNVKANDPARTIVQQFALD